MNKMDDSMYMTFKKLTLYVLLLVFIAVLSGQGVFADEARVVFGVE